MYNIPILNSIKLGSFNQSIDLVSSNSSYDLTGLTLKQFSSYIDSTSKSIKKSQTLGHAAINNETDISEFVTSLTDAELRLKMLITVRDQLTSSINEILKMQI